MLFDVPGPRVPDEGPKGHSGPQERVDLFFVYPSLEAPGGSQKNTCGANTIEDAVQPIDRIFLSIAAHHDVLAPEGAAATISALPRSGLVHGARMA